MITTRIVDNGEMVAAGSPLFDIVDLDKLYLKVYVPEKEIGKVRLGLPAPNFIPMPSPINLFSAILRYIASGAEFTPKEVQTPDERVKLVYAVKLYLNENSEHKLTPGLPADAVIRWQEESPWRNLAGKRTGCYHITGLCKSYKKKLAINSVDLTVSAEKFMG